MARISIQLVSLLLLFCVTPSFSTSGLIKNLPGRFTPAIEPSFNDAALFMFPAAYFFSLNIALEVRYTFLIIVSRYEVLAACHPIALSFFGTKDPIPKRFCDSPETVGILISRIIYRHLIQEFPIGGVSWGNYLVKNGVDIFDNSRDIETVAGWANVIADRSSKYFKEDGWNSQGSLTKENYRHPFDDTTAYLPQNHAGLKPDELLRPLRWQPQSIPSQGFGVYSSELHAVPHIGLTVSPLVLSSEEFESRTVPPLYEQPSRLESISEKDNQTVLEFINMTLERSQNLTEKKVALSHWWKNKASSIGAFRRIYGRIIGNVSFSEHYRMGLGEMMAQYDMILLSWKEKRRHDLASPTGLIRRMLKGQKIRAWNGINNGVEEIKAEEWEPILPFPSVSDYPSAHSAICTASLEHTEIAINNVVLKGNGTIPTFTYTIPPQLFGNSGIKKGVEAKFKTMSEAAESCREARLNSGLHFPQSIEAGRKLSEGVGLAAYEHVKDLWEGRVPKNCARCMNA